MYDKALDFRLAKLWKYSLEAPGGPSQHPHSGNTQRLQHPIIPLDCSKINYVDSVALLESFRALKFTLLESLGL